MTRLLQFTEEERRLVGVGVHPGGGLVGMVGSAAGYLVSWVVPVGCWAEMMTTRSMADPVTIFLAATSAPTRATAAPTWIQTTQRGRVNSRATYPKA